MALGRGPAPGTARLRDLLRRLIRPSSKASDPITSSTSLPNQPSTGCRRNYQRWRWQIFGITWLAYAGFYLTRKSFAVAKIEMGRADSLNLSQTDLAWVDGSFLLAYAIGQFVFGMCGDRFGPRRVILVGLMGSVVVALATGLVAPSVVPAGIASMLEGALLHFGVTMMTAMLGVLMFAQGLFQSSGWAPLSKNLGSFFARHERGVIMGFWCTNYAVGGLVASAYAGYVGERFGWRAAFLFPAATLFGIWILFFFLQRNRPEDVGLDSAEIHHSEAMPEHSSEPGSAGRKPEDGAWQVVLEVCRNRIVLLLCAVYFCLKPARYAILFWGPKYVSDRLGTGMFQSGLLSAMFEAAGPFSVLLGGWASDRLFRARRMPVAAICLLMLSLMLFFLDSVPPKAWMLGGWLFLIGLLTYAPDSLVSGTAAVDFGTRRGASTASGLINGFGSIGAIAGGSLPGFMHEQVGWQGVFSLLGASVLLAGLLILPKWNVLPEEPPARGGASISGRTPRSDVLTKLTGG